MGEFFDFDSHPGHLYVVATLLPLASFLVLLLAGLVRGLVRNYRHTGWAAGLYHMLGSDHPQRGPADVATGAIGLAFVLSLIGFLRFADDQGLFTGHHAGHEHAGSAGAVKDQDDHDKDHGRKDADHEHDRSAVSWSGHIVWAEIGFASDEKPKPATQLTLGYHIDSLAAIMFLMVTLIATLIHLFSIGYMSEELAPVVEDHQVHTEHGHLRRRGRFGRFFLYMSLFCFSMLNLVLADNLFQVFVSWELVGLCSYLLIGFYYERRSASNAANKAFITNRIGDAGFIIGLLIIWTHLGTFNFDELFKQVRAPAHDARHELEFAGEIVRAKFVEDNPGSGTKSVEITTH